MQDIPVITQKDMVNFLLGVADKRPVFIWGPPGVGKSSIVEEYAAKMGLECISLLGSQLSPEDVMGVPQIVDGRIQFCPPRLIAREKPYCLFLDELNACSDDVQKAFYSLIHDRKVGEYVLPQGSVVIAAGNRKSDASIVKGVSSALINRMINIFMDVSPTDWLRWAERNQLHPLVITYIRQHPEQLSILPGSEEKPFSTPRSWHMLSDSLLNFKQNLSPAMLKILVYGCLFSEHAAQFEAYFLKNVRLEADIAIEQDLPQELYDLQENLA
ncbi:MAG: AAA family ATPase [Alphaproteobacteria bacterium]|nr:AAA family ATPase [Alphaproteobacteria bacterium]